MLPIGPMMIEHRLIERMIKVVKEEINKIEETMQVSPALIDTAVDFIRVYADQTHHGKEEDILFRELNKKKLDATHQKVMDELIEDHKVSRKTTVALVEAKEKFVAGEAAQLDVILEKLKFLVDFYPKHIEKEDKHFFVPVMEYFTKEEQQAQLIEGYEYDRKMIHRKYEKIVVDAEKAKNIYMEKNSKWINFL
jgi:hemerythrin-like domain-containing protein